MQLWQGRFKKSLSKTTNDFNSSISFDSRMFREDIQGSIAHATMLGETGIIKKEESLHIVEGLKVFLKIYFPVNFTLIWNVKIFTHLLRVN